MTVAGDIVTGTTAATVSTLALSGGTLELAARNIGTPTAPLTNLTFTGGTLSNPGTVYQSVNQNGATSVFRVAANNAAVTTTGIGVAYTLTSGTATLADGTTLTATSAGPTAATLFGGTTLGIGFGSSPTSSGTLVAAGGIDLTGLTAAARLNVPLTATTAVVAGQAYTLTIISSASAGIAYTGGAFDPAAFNVTAENFAAASGFTVSGTPTAVTVSFTAAVPEPATVLGLAAVGFGFGRLVRRRRESRITT